MRSEYNRKNYNTTNPAPNVVAAVMTAVQEEMTVMENRIISAVARGSNEQADDATSHITDGTADASKRKIANSGSIDSFLVAQNKRPRSNN